MKERNFQSLDLFKAAVKASKYKLVKRNNERLGDFYIAEGKNGPVGSFCAKYPRDSYLITN